MEILVSSWSLTFEVDEMMLNKQAAQPVTEV